MHTFDWKENPRTRYESHLGEKAFPADLSAYFHRFGRGDDRKEEESRPTSRYTRLLNFSDRPEECRVSVTINPLEKLKRKTARVHSSLSRRGTPPFKTFYKMYSRYVRHLSNHPDDEQIDSLWIREHAKLHEHVRKELALRPINCNYLKMTRSQVRRRVILTNKFPIFITIVWKN